MPTPEPEDVLFERVGDDLFMWDRRDGRLVGAIDVDEFARGIAEALAPLVKRR